jgi:hypothetical protein
LKQSHNSNKTMKKSKAKSKMGHGGARLGAGRLPLWKHRPLKMVRLPLVFVEEILKVAQYMDQNDGRLPFSQASGHPSKSLPGEEIKELAAREKARKLAERVMVGDEWVLVSDETFRNQH